MSRASSDFDSESSDSEPELSLPVTSYHRRGEQEAEVEGSEIPHDDPRQEENESQLGAYSNEPIADDAWLQEYNRAREVNGNFLVELQQRLDGSVSRDSW